MTDTPSAGPRRVSLPFHVSHPVVGMVHLPPLQGAPGEHLPTEDILAAAESDAEALHRAGVDGILVENFGDAPFFPADVPPETVAAITLAVDRVRRAVPLPVGVNVLRNDAAAAVGIAAVTGAEFIRVNVHVGTAWTDQGPLEGRAYRTLRLRKALGHPCAILADVHVKHATPVPGESLEAAASDTWHRGLADALVVSGVGTGHATDPDRMARVARAVPHAPLWVGSGVTEETISTLWHHASGFIVGSALQEGGRAGGRVDVERATRFMGVVQERRALG
ncbi:MAG: BtpA/SgcQ family protein [Gemmatimonadales bacterium]|nr:MAG: BtpA/SgcQ family protein [Gemmatimonadales bacterium]